MLFEKRVGYCIVLIFLGLSSSLASQCSSSSFRVFLSVIAFGKAEDGVRGNLFVALSAEQHNKRIVMALQSGLKGELSWAINALTVLSFKEKDDARKDAPPLAKVPGLLDALLHVVNLLAELSLLVVMLLVVVVVVVVFFPLFFCNVTGLWISLQMVP